MRRFLFALLGLLLFAACQPRPTSPEAAMAYNNAIVSHGDTVLAAFDAFNSSVDARDRSHAEKRLELAINSAQRATTSIMQMEPLDGDSSLRDATLALMRFYERVFKQGFRPMLPILLADTLSEPEAIRVDSLVHDFSFEEDSLRSIMLTAQANFSKRYGLTLH